MRRSAKSAAGNVPAGVVVGGPGGQRRDERAGGGQRGGGVGQCGRGGDGHVPSLVPCPWKSTDSRPGRPHPRVGVAAGQPPQHAHQRWAHAGQGQPDAVPGGLGDQPVPVDEQRRVVDARRGAAGDPLADRHRDQPGQPGVRDRVEHQRAARPQHPAGLGDSGREVGHVLEDLAGGDGVGHPVRDRQPLHVAAYRPDAVLGRDPQRDRDQVDADVPVAEPGRVRGEQPGPAAEVDQQRAGPGRRRQQLRPGGRDPAQHRELPVRLPPLVGHALVLSDVVARQPRRGGRAPGGHAPTLGTTVGLLRVVQRSGAWLPVGQPGREAVRGQQLDHLRVVVDDDRDLAGPPAACAARPAW